MYFDVQRFAEEDISKQNIKSLKEIETAQKSLWNRIEELRKRGVEVDE